MKRFFLPLILAVLAPVLAACSASCDCPHCPAATTTVVTPPGHSTVIEPAD